MSGVSGNYMSDGAILAWVTQQQNKLYGDLEDTMQQQQLQSQMADDLADIKQHLQELTKHPENAVAVDAELVEFMKNYGSNPQFESIAGSVQSIEQAVRQQIPPDQTLVSVVGAAGAAAAGIHSGSPSSTLQGNGHGGASQSGQPSNPAPLTDDQIKTWTDDLDKKLSDAGTNEQLGMVHINEVKSTIDQGTQMASQLIKSSNDSTTSVIHNIA